MLVRRRCTVSPRLALGLGLGVALVAALLALFFLLARRRVAVAPARLPADPTLADLVAHLPGMAYRCRADGGFELVSAGAQELTGYPPGEGLTAGVASLRSLVHEEDLSAVEAEVAAALAEGRPYQATYRLHTRDGAERWALEKGTRVDEAGTAYLEGFIADITAQKVAEDRMQQEALHDPLTGLPNRVLVLRAARRRHPPAAPAPGRHLRAAVRGPRPLQADHRDPRARLGDEVLQGTARRLVGLPAPEDTVARVGGDEFAILLEDVGDAEGGARVARRVCEVVNLPLYLGGEEVFVTASVGIASSLSGYDSPEHPLRDAAIAMGRAKSQGGATLSALRPRHARIRARPGAPGDRSPPRAQAPGAAPALPAHLPPGERPALRLRGPAALAPRRAGWRRPASSFARRRRPG